MANKLLDGKLLEDGAGMVVKTNLEWSSHFKIESSKRCTCVKPSGNASAILGLSCSGIHPAHTHKYLRRVRITDQSPEWKKLQGTPLVKFNGSEYIISFPIELNEDVRTKEGYAAAEHMKYIGMVKHFWVNKGVRKYRNDDMYPNNVSATVEVDKDEWGEVSALMYANSHLFSGCSFLPKFKQHYPDLPFSRLYTDEEKKEYEEIKKYLEKNEIDFRDIMRGQEVDANSMAAMACSGGACEIK